MNAQTLGTLALVGGGVVVAVWVLNKVGRALTAVGSPGDGSHGVAGAVVHGEGRLCGGQIRGDPLAHHPRWLAPRRCGCCGGAGCLSLVTLVGCRGGAGGVAVAAPDLVRGVGGAVVAVVVAALDRLRPTTTRLAPGLRPDGADADRPIVLTANPLGRNKVRRQPKPRVDQVPEGAGGAVGRVVG